MKYTLTSQTPSLNHSKPPKPLCTIQCPNPKSSKPVQQNRTKPLCWFPSQKPLQHSGPYSNPHSFKDRAASRNTCSDEVLEFCHAGLAVPKARGIRVLLGWFRISGWGSLLGLGQELNEGTTAITCICIREADGLTLAFRGPSRVLDNYLTRGLATKVMAV